MTPLEQAALEFALAYLGKLVHDGPGYPVADARKKLVKAAEDHTRDKLLAKLPGEWGVK